MYRKNLLVLSVALAAAGCSDSPTSIAIPYAAQPAIQEIQGTVSVDATYGTITVHLMLAEGTRVLLEGSEAQRLASVDGAEVLVRGDWARGAQSPIEDDATPLGEAQGAFNVVEFVVTAVDGHAALDGMLVETGDGYGLQLAGGTVRLLDDPPPELLEHLGERIWVTGLDEERFMRFGVIP